MMNFIEIAKKRYSVRNYSGKKVEKEKLDKILQAAHDLHQQQQTYSRFT